MIDRQRFVDLLGCHVVRRAHCLTGAGQHRDLSDELGQAEVGDLHLALRVDQDVLRLHVAVHHALAVGVLQGAADRWHQLERACR